MVRRGIGSDPRVGYHFIYTGAGYSGSCFPKDGDLQGKTFALWDLSFKPNTDDMREAPSRVLKKAQWKAGARVQACDPEAIEETQRIYGSRDGLNLCGTKEAA